MKRCFNCAKLVGGDDYCHGCKQHVCRECDAMKPTGPHKKEAHLGPVPAKP